MIYFNISAKQNQKFPFHFLSAPPTPRAEEKEMQGKFLVFAPATEGSGRGAQQIHWSLRSKKVRAKATISPQIETSRSESEWMPRADGAGVGKRWHRSATNWDGMGISKRADLSLVSYLKTNI